MAEQLSLIYRSPWIYHRVMRLLHGRNFKHRYEMIAAEIPDGSSVTELCAGDAWLYLHYLKQKHVRYVGLDVSPHFVKAACVKGLDFRLHDLRKDHIPAADIVIMQASLYQFPELAEGLVRQMISAAGVKVVISEPVRNLSHSSHPWIAGLARRITRAPGHATASHRFTPETFRGLMESFPQCEQIFMEKGEREMIAVLRGEGHSI